MSIRRLSCVACLFAPAVAVVAAVSSPAQGASVIFPTSQGGNNHVYEVVLDPGVNRADASAAATASAGHLLSINSAAEQAFVEQMLYVTNSPTGGYWMGIERVSNNGQGVADDFHWDTGEPLTYENFALNEPNYYLNMEDAGQVYWSADMIDDVNVRRGGWNDVPVTGYAQSPVTDLVTAGFIIERPEVDENSPPVAIPLPPAIVGAPLAFAMAGLAMMRRRRVA